jgi:hypothetical protein
MLSAGSAGLRHVMVVLDADGQPISAGDHVLTCRELTDSTASSEGMRREDVHEGLGGRLEPDGSFNGTRWRMVRVVAADEAGAVEDFEATPFDAQPSTPTADDIAGIKALVRGYSSSCKEHGTSRDPICRPRRARAPLRLTSAT